MPKTGRTISRPGAELQASGQGNSPARLVAQANRWRENYNPLRSLVISIIVARLEEGEQGRFQDLMWLERFVEKRFPVLRALILRRRSALLKLDWDIKTVAEFPPGSTEAQAEAQKDHLRAKYDAIENLKEAVKALALAEFRGFAILQKHRDESGAITELHWLPQWHFARDGQFGPFYFDEKSQSSAAATLGEANRIGGDELPREEFLIRECDMPVNEIALRAFQSWNMGVKDWAAFVEMFGLPGCIVEMPPNTSAADMATAEAEAAKAAEGSSGVIPNGAKAYFPTAQIRGSAPFKEFIDAQIADVVLAGTGGKLSMLNEATGIGGSQGEKHADAFDEIANGEAKEISEIFQRDFDKIELAAAFPGQPVLAYFELAAQDEEDANDYVQRVVALNSAGYRTDPEEVSEKAGHELVEEANSNPMSPAAASADVDPQTSDDPGEFSALDDAPDDGEELIKNRGDEDGVWRTINGQPIFIPDGTSVAEAVKQRFGGKGSKSSAEKSGGRDSRVAGTSEGEAESGVDRAAKEKIALKTTKQRAFRGEPVLLKTKLSKQETGAIGERIVVAYLHARGMKDARALNVKQANYAVDLVQDHGAIEVKTGLVSNGKSAQQWRATIGQPGKAESKKLAKMSAEKKAAWNQAKADAILRRKEKAVAALSKKLGRPVKSWTMTTILNPDTRTVDVYRFKGFHLRIPWNSDLARKSYVGSYKY